MTERTKEMLWTLFGFLLYCTVFGILANWLIKVISNT